MSTLVRPQTLDNSADPAIGRDTRGLLELVFRRDAAGRTVLAGRRQRFPLRTTVPFRLDEALPGMAWVYVQNPTGGVFAGDVLALDITALPATQVHLTTQSATKLYRMHDRGEACQRTALHVGAGAYVENLPDPLIPHAGSRYRQTTVVDMAPDAICISAETLCPGRRAHGERFAFDLVQLRTDVHADGRLLCTERLQFEPLRGRLDRPGVMRSGDYLVTLLALAPGYDADALAEALDRALSLAVRRRDDPGAVTRASAGPLPNGAGARAVGLAADAPTAQMIMRTAWNAARTELLGVEAPRVRK